ncbi:predicted protein [Postia placenta Mad-698-R]|nr:predicted protein [Postia placenta Mad-698-R]
MASSDVSEPRGAPFWGVACGQFFYYSRRYSRDRWHIKALVSYGLSLLCLSHLALWVFDATFSYEDVHIMTFVLSVLANTWYRPVIVVATIFEFSDVSGNEVLLAVVSCGVPFMFPFAFISLIYLFWVSIWFCMERLLDRLTVIIVNRALMTTILQLGQFITYRAFSPDVFVWIIFHSAAAKALLLIAFACYQSAGPDASSGLQNLEWFMVFPTDTTVGSARHILLIALFRGALSGAGKRRHEGLPKGRMREVFTRTKFMSVEVASPLQTVSASVADIITTTTLVLFMRDKRTGLKSMERLLDRLTVIIVNRALMTTILQLGQFITYRAFSPDVFVWIIFHSAAAKGVSVDEEQ